MIKERNTKQKEMVITFLSKNKDKHFTAEEVLLNIKSKNSKISQATVYRILGQLVNNSVVRKYSAGDNKACYQYIDDAGGCNMHYHLSCDKCGKTIHFESDDVTALKNKVAEENGFDINLQKVVLYGKCKHCK